MRRVCTSGPADQERNLGTRYGLEIRAAASPDAAGLAALLG